LGKKKEKQPKPQFLTCFNHVKMEKNIKIIFDQLIWFLKKPQFISIEFNLQALVFDNKSYDFFWVTFCSL